MSADNLAQNSQLADTQSEIVTAGGRDIKPDNPVDIEKVAQLARFYAAGTPPAEEFRAIKEWVGVVSKEPPEKQ